MVITENIHQYREIEKLLEKAKEKTETLKKIYPLLITCVVKGTIEEYEKLIRDYPKPKYAEEAYFKLVWKYQRLGKTSEGIRILENFIKNYPESKMKE